MSTCVGNESLMSTVVEINSLSKKEIRALLRKSERRLQVLSQRNDAMDYAEDERVCAIANAILSLAYHTKIPKAEIFAAVAGNMRIPVKDVVPPAEEPRAAASQTVPDAEEQAPEALNISMLEQAEEPKDAGHRKLTLPNGRRSRATLDVSVKHRSRRSLRRPSQSATHVKHQVPKAAAAGSDVVYRHPVDADKTWDGQGAMPKWLRDAVSFGRSLEEFRVG